MQQLKRTNGSGGSKREKKRHLVFTIVILTGLKKKHRKQSGKRRKPCACIFEGTPSNPRRRAGGEEGPDPAGARRGTTRPPTIETNSRKRGTKSRKNSPGIGGERGGTGRLSTGLMVAAPVEAPLKQPLSTV